jgi:hypothetical protein
MDQHTNDEIPEIVATEATRFRHSLRVREGYRSTMPIA